MKHFPSFRSCLLVLGLWPGLANAQQVSLPENNLPQTVTPGTPVPLNYPALDDITGVTKYNYVRSDMPDIPAQTMPNLNNPPVRRVTDYFDGLGRPLQSVARKAHADGRDVISHHVYDAAGREVYHYQPFIRPAENSYGLFVPNVETRMHQFYDLQSAQGTDEEPYSQTVFDNSPLNRVTEQRAPGKSWAGSSRGVQYAYGGNAITDATGQYPVFTIGYGNTDLPVQAGSYDAGTLYVNKVTDEDGKTSLEISDRKGRVLIKRQQTATLPAGVTFQPQYFATTIYVYDDMDRLRFVIPPAAAAAAVSGTGPYTWNITQAIADGLCYRYFYDGRGRMIEKKIPGKDAEYYVYDKRDRPVFYQDGNLRLGGNWSFTTFDALDRPMSTGIATWGMVSRSYIQNFMDNPVAYPTTDIMYYLCHYDLWHVYPPVGTISCRFLSYTYYDDYTDGALSSSFTFDPDQFANISIPNSTVSLPQLSANTQGRMTGSRVRIMDPADPNGDSWLTTAYYYDDKGRVIQTVADNVRGGKEYSSNLYYFQGMLWKNITGHENQAALALPEATDGPFPKLRIEKTYNRNLLDGGGSDQVKQITQKIGTGTVYNLASYSYDHLARTTVKQFPAANVLQEYNMRGFLNHIDVANFNNDPTNGDDDQHIFEENLYYDQGFASKLYNGNIAGITWRKAGDAAPVEAYGYSYDNLNRLTHAQYEQAPVGSTSWSTTAYDYTASNISYDLNGNLQSMDQQGVTGGSSSPIPMDKLTYNYAATSNRLIKVTDGVAAANTAGLPDFKDGANLSEEYSYDANGNMITDANKHITGITYNYLNKPDVITVDGQGTIIYVYDATGNRLRKTAHYTSGTTPDEVYDYIGNFVYKDNTLQYILNEEGRARPIVSNHLTKYVYDYFVKDHLGNVRSTVTAEPIDGIYLANHELAQANIEQLVFDNIPNVRGGRPGSTDPEDHMAAELVGEDPDKRVGTAIMLKVMPGDRFDISVDAYYEGEVVSEDQVAGADVISSLMGALTGGANYDGVPLSELPDNVKTIKNLLGDVTSLGSVLDALQANDNPAVPKAHLNYLFFNDKMELVQGASGSVQVPYGLQGWGPVTPPPNNVLGGSTQIAAPEPGYVIVYIDNQTIGKKVWFDHLMVGHHKGKVIEQDHYYPFGLTLQTDVDANVTENKRKYQGIELEKHFGLETYETFYRGLDPQLGRFNSVDPKSEIGYSISPYASMDNNPVSKTDPMGDFTGGDDDDQEEQPSRFAVGMYNLLSMLGNIGRALSPPGTESSKRFYREEVPQNANELVTDAKAGLDMMMLLGAPLEMIYNTSLPTKAVSSEVREVATMEVRTDLPAVNIGFSQKTNEGILDVGADIARVRHHTSLKGLRGIKSNMSINTSYGSPLGVDVEVAPFVKPSKAKMGQSSTGAYVEFSVPRSLLTKKQGYMGGVGNAARIPTNGLAPLKINTFKPKFVNWRWWRTSQ